MRVSRRGLLRCWAAPIGATLIRRMAAAPLRVELAKEFPASTVRAVSPDGTKLCVEDWKESGYPIRVLEMGTWRVAYTGHFEARTYWADFFADSQTLMVGYPVPARAIIDLRTGERAVNRDPFDSRNHQGE